MKRSRSVQNTLASKSDWVPDGTFFYFSNFYSALSGIFFARILPGMLTRIMFHLSKKWRLS